ncbi:hypothetical protein BU25DRAFT_72645 [Macroventuria anomochaeta]|uniref:Uncharacterized protein n=1 Tax=Macroventuria anomochaeta TaxID=301207 RepID=A0ACB6S090_9PLEO|nr:uncharacterized protein BU25DRAFT_72645 [Macroventuria anomochaeta]KAF2626819.1 hypothetical protein BU25DRAFT_72645 [Macroventuria anomochaeta]
MAFPSLDEKKALAQGISALWDTGGYVVCRSTECLQEATCPSWKLVGEEVVRSSLRHTVSAVSSTLDATLSAAEKEEVVHAWVAIISFGLFWVLLVFTLYPLVALIREHIVKRSLLAPTETEEAGEDTSGVQGEYDGEEDQVYDSDHDEGYYSEGLHDDFEHEDSETESSSDYAPDNSELRSLIGPSWFPLGLSYAFGSGTFLATLAWSEARFALPTVIETDGPIKAKERKIVALEAELNAKVDQHLACEAEAQDLRAIVARKEEKHAATVGRITPKREEQGKHMRAARKDLEAIRKHITEYGVMFRQLRDENEALLSKLSDKSPMVEELRMNNDRRQFEVDDLRVSNAILIAANEHLEQHNEELQRRNEDIERENVNWKNTMRALRAPDSETQRLKSQLAEASHTISMLRAEVADREQEVGRVEKTSRHSETRLRTTIDDLQDSAWKRDIECAKYATDMTAVVTSLRIRIVALETDNTELSHELEYLRHNVDEQAKFPRWEESEEAVKALNLRIQGLERGNERLNKCVCRWAELAKERGRELVWLRYAVDEVAKYPLWESEGFESKEFADEGFEDLQGTADFALEEGGYEGSEAIELLEDEEETVEDFEEVLLDDFKEKFEQVSHFTDSEASESDTESGGGDMCGDWGLD